MRVSTCNYFEIYGYLNPDLMLIQLLAERGNSCLGS